MTKSPHLSAWDARNFALISIVFAIAIASGCSQDSAVDPAPAPTDKFYNASPVQIDSTQVSNDLGVPVELSDSKDFSNEYQYDRVLNLLENNKPIIMPLIPSILKIYIGDTTSAQQSGDQYVISLATSIDQLTLQRFFQQSFPDQVEDQKFFEALQSKLGIQIDDSIGLRGGDLTAISAKLNVIAEQVEFNQDPTFSVMTLGTSYEITTAGGIINAYAPADEMVAQLQQMISARIQWREEMVPFLADLGLSLTYQPGVFSGDELQQAMSNIKVNAMTIREHLNRFSRVVVGKRWDVDYARGVLLMDAQSTGDDLVAHLNQLDPSPSDSDFANAKQNVVQAFAALQIHLDTVTLSFNENQSNYGALTSFSTTVVPALSATNLQALKIHSVHLALAGSIVTNVLLATGELFVGLPTSADQLNALLAQEVSLMTVTPQIQHLQQSCARLGLSFLNGVMGQDARVASALGSINNWIDAGGISGNDVQRLKLMTLEIVDADPYSNPTRISGYDFVINFQDFQAANMNAILNPPAPTPTPVPED